MQSNCKSTRSMKNHADHRLACEVRYILSLRDESKDRCDQYLSAVKKARGKGAADELRSLAAEQWQRGNRGKFGDWIKGE